MLTYRSVESQEPLGVRDSILASAVSEWKTEAEQGAKEGETQLTKKIMEGIQSCMNDNTLHGYNVTNKKALMIEAEKDIKGTRTIEDEGKGRMDFVVLKKYVNLTKKRSVVMIVEFGMGHMIWWQKMSQILKYVNILCEATDQDNDVTFDQPILLTIVTVYKNPKNKNKNKISTINEEEEETVSDDVTNIKTQDVHETDTDTTSGTGTKFDQKLEFRYGVFLCMRRVDGRVGNKYRIALLWRKDTFSMTDASIQFGKILDAAQVCASLRGRVAAKLIKPNNGKEALYQYLGPNCCRIGELVSQYISVF